MGLEVLCLDAQERPPAHDLGARCFPVDFGQPGLALDFARELHQQYPIDGVITVGTDFSLTVSLIAQELGLPAHSPQAAYRATDKYTMRQALSAAGLAVPQFVLLTDGLDLPDGLSFPLVVKPCDSMGARGVVKVSNHKELEEAYCLAKEHSRTQRVIVEEYLSGPEFSLDGLIQGTKKGLYGLADRQIALEPKFVEVGHSFPSARPRAEIEAVTEAFWQGVEALGLDQGAVKGDIKFSQGRAVIGEIAGRLSGGFMSGWTYPYHSGRSAITGAINIAIGKSFADQDPPGSRPVYEGALISPPGEIEALEWHWTLPRSEHFTWLHKCTGDRTVFPINNVQKVGNAILVPTIQDKRPAWDKAAFLREMGCQWVRLVARDSETEEFFREEERLLWVTSQGTIPRRTSLPQLPSPWLKADQGKISGFADLFGNPLPEQFHRCLEAQGLGLGAIPDDLQTELWLAYCLGGPSLMNWRYRR
jgi:biotin carboxylase